MSIIPVEFRDCRLCANFTTRSGGCLAVAQCVDSDLFRETAPRRYWQLDTSLPPVKPEPKK